MQTSICINLFEVRDGFALLVIYVDPTTLFSFNFGVLITVFLNHVVTASKNSRLLALGVLRGVCVQV